MIVITGSVQGDDSSIAELTTISLEHVRRSRAEPGCLSHDVHHHAEDRNRLVFVERWADMAAVMAHFAVPQSQSFVRDISALALSPPDIQIFDATLIPFAMGKDG